MHIIAIQCCDNIVIRGAAKLAKRHIHGFPLAREWQRGKRPRSEAGTGASLGSGGKRHACAIARISPRVVRDGQLIRVELFDSSRRIARPLDLHRIEALADEA